MDWSSEFPILNELVFMNHAGVAPISGRAASAMKIYANEAANFAYTQGHWYRRIREIKTAAAQLINARGPQEIAFIPNTSTGISSIANGITDWCEGDNVIISDVEYPANRYPWEDLKRHGVELIEVRQQADGHIDVDQVCNAITNSTRIVSLSHVQYASGFRINLKPISEMVHHAGGYLCVDGIQSVGLLPVDVQAMGIDFLSADGHKWMLGPEGFGILYINEDLIPMLHPHVVGWMNMVQAMDFGNYRFEFQPDARRFEPGSYNIPGMLALGASLDMILEVGIDEIWKRTDALTTQLCDGLPQAGYRVLSPREPNACSGIVVFEPPPPGSTPALAPGSVPQSDADLNVKRIVSELEKQNIHIVTRNGRLRASPHFYNQPEQIEQLLDALKGCGE